MVLMIISGWWLWKRDWWQWLHDSYKTLSITIIIMIDDNLTIMTTMMMMKSWSFQVQVSDGCLVWWGPTFKLLAQNFDYLETILFRFKFNWIRNTNTNCWSQTVRNTVMSRSGQIVLKRNLQALQGILQIFVCKLKSTSRKYNFCSFEAKFNWQNAKLIMKLKM